MKVLGGLKILGDAISSTGLQSVSDSVFKSENVVNSAFSNLPDTKVFASVTHEIEPTLSALVKSNGLSISNEELVRGARHMSEVLGPLSSQITISPKLSESLKLDRITAALDKPIVIDSSLSRLGINENINLTARQKTDLLGIEATDSKIQISSLENHKSKDKNDDK